MRRQCGHGWRRTLATAFQTTDYLFMPGGAPASAWVETILQRFAGPSFAGQTLEIGVHPGRSEPWRLREMDAATLFAQAARTAGHTFINWKDIRPSSDRRQ